MHLDETTAPQPAAAGPAAPHPLPPGQRPAPLEPFGLTPFAAVHPRVPARPSVTVGGAVRRPTQFDAAELLALPGHGDRRTDLHCVTTWTAVGLEWHGVPFQAVHEMIAREVEPRGSARWVTFIALDGFRATMLLDDALAGGVLLADTLGGVPLTPDNGAPLRLVAPAHYGYKNVKHVCAIEYGTRYKAGWRGWMSHPRGRVAREERSRFLPGRVWRLFWRALLPSSRKAYTALRERTR